MAKSVLLPLRTRFTEGAVHPKAARLHFSPSMSGRKKISGPIITIIRNLLSSFRSPEKIGCTVK